MKFSQIGLPVVVASLMGFVFLGPQRATSQDKVTAPADPFVQIPSQNVPAQDTLNDFNGVGFQRAGDPELEKLHRQEAETQNAVANLLAAYGRTDKEGERATIKKKLTEALEKQFDAQQKRREIEVARIEAQLKKLRDMIAKRTDKRQTIIDKRLDQLLQEAEGLGWSSPQGVGFSFYRNDSMIPALDATRP
jgi:hypothetical protein